MQSKIIETNGEKCTVSGGKGYIVIYKTASGVLTDVAGIVTHIDDMCITLENKKKVLIEKIEKIIEI
ncbi:MAG: hypothetical protein RR162_02005 [Oscillospiraceae bacterium]